MVQKSMLNYLARKDAETAASNAPILSHIRVEPHPTSLSQGTTRTEGNLQLLQSITERVHPDGTGARHPQLRKPTGGKPTERGTPTSNSS